MLKGTYAGRREGVQAGTCAGRNVCRLYRRRGKRLDEGPIAFLAARYDREVQECRKEGKGG